MARDPDSAIFTHGEFKTILRCLHPDAAPTPEQKAAAFALLNERRALLVPKRDLPPPPGLPTTLTDLLARRDHVRRQNRERGKKAAETRKKAAETRKRKHPSRQIGEAKP